MRRPGTCTEGGNGGGHRVAPRLEEVLLGVRRDRHVRRRVCAGGGEGGESVRGEEGRGGTGGGGGADAAPGWRGAAAREEVRDPPGRPRRAGGGRRGGGSHATQVSTKPSPIWSSSRNEPSDWSTEPAVTLPAHDEHAPARHEYGRSRPSSSACERVIAGVRGRSRIRPRGLVPSGNSPEAGAPCAPCRGCTCHPGSRSSTRRPACSA